MSYTIPIGPYHLALEEPYKIEVHCEGETVTGADLKVGFNFRGIEWLAERKNLTQSIALMERVCGICSNVHSMTFCLALERIGRIEVPARAQYIRVVMAELERIHSHLLWAGVAAELTGFHTLFMTCFNLREDVMDLLEAISGNRVNYSMNRIGGVNRDILCPDDIRAGIRTIRGELERSLIPIFTQDRILAARCAGVGVLAREDALAWGAVGPLARASGVDQDLRRDAPYLVYGELDFQVPVRVEGDVFARVVVRALELLESCRLVEQALDRMPAGPLHGPDHYFVTPGETTMRIEAPRGEVFYFVATDGTDRPRRVKVRTPTFANIPTVLPMVRHAALADVPLIQASIDPCYSCTDR
ncbi:MAG TPA: nickel-dependent hydrogenase large subunit [Holophaga sp.]|nr:nickel-dependent hydrogenase large subunit [Holophaga sp.]